MLLLRDICYAIAILAALAVVYTTLGTLNGRLAGGFTPENTAWALSVAVFAISTPLGVAAKIVLRLRRRKQPLLRANPSGQGWLVDQADPGEERRP